MSSQSRLQKAETLLAPWAISVATPATDRLDVLVAAQDVPAVASALSRIHWGYLSTITGLDLGVEKGDIEMLYHFSSGPDNLVVRTRCARLGGTLPTVARLIPAASVYEREVMEMLGVTFVGTPVPDRLFLPEDWPQGVYPLLKDFDPAAAARETE